MHKLIKIEKLWKGMADVRDYDAVGAHAKGKDLLIVYNGEAMLIPRSKIMDYKEQSKVFASKTGGKPYSLFSYPWKAGFKV